MTIYIIIEGIEDEKFLKDYLAYLGYKEEGIKFVPLETDIESKLKSTQDKIDRLINTLKSLMGKKQL